MKKRSAVFALAMGILMVLVWVVYIATDQADFTAPLEATALLAAEALTALTLIAGGIGILTGKVWGISIHIASLGMMLYTATYSIGVFAQAGVIPASVFFALLTIVTILVLLAWTRRPFREWETPLCRGAAREAATSSDRGS